MTQSIRSNFDMLRPYEEQLWRLGAVAERYFAEDPNTSLLKLRQFSEILAQSLAARTGQLTNPSETQYELIRRLGNDGVLPREVKQVFDQIRANGNAANHALEGHHASAMALQARLRDDPTHASYAPARDTIFFSLNPLSKTASLALRHGMCV